MCTVQSKVKLGNYKFLATNINYIYLILVNASLGASSGTLSIFGIRWLAISHFVLNIWEKNMFLASAETWNNSMGPNQTRFF